MANQLVRTPEFKEEFALVERMDEQQIANSLAKGEVIEKYVYSFNSRGEEVYSLSWPCIRTIAQLMGNIHCKQVSLEINDGIIYSVYSAHDLVRNLKFEGAAQQDVCTKGGNKDDFAFAKVVAKSQRNAIRNLLPIEIYQTLLAFYVQNKRLKEEDMLRLLIPDNIEKYGFDSNKVEDYCIEQFGEPIEVLPLEDLKRLSLVLGNKKGIQLFSKSNNKGE